MANRFKYVMYEHNGLSYNFILLPLVMNHNSIQHTQRIKSAGFVELSSEEGQYGSQIIKADCFGKSITLNKESNPGEDSKIITISLSLD